MLTKSMKKVKVDACLIKKLIINRMDISGGYFSKLSVWKQIVVILTGMSNQSFSQILSGIMAKFISLKQVATFCFLFIQPKTYTFFCDASASYTNQHFQKRVNAEYSYSLLYSKKCETPRLHFLAKCF